MLQGSNHVRFEGFASPLRLTTDVPLSYLGGQPFALTGRRHLVLTWGAPVEEPLAPLCDRFLERDRALLAALGEALRHPAAATSSEVIRSALALKLHCFEDTGAIVAAMTTSIPEAPGSGRTWDYRYCWLRDAYYVLGAFRLLGHFEEREQLRRSTCSTSPAARPTSSSRRSTASTARCDLEERILDDWPGFNGEGPVRVGNGAALHRSTTSSARWCWR